MARPDPRSRSRDMVISMAVLLVPLLAVIWLFTLDPAPEVEAIDLRPELERAEAQAPYPILRAVRLPQGWTPVRAAWATDGAIWLDQKPAVGNTWLVGYLGPDEIYYGLEQRDRAVVDVIERVTRDGRETGTVVEAAGLSWRSYESRDGRTTSLVAQEDGMVAVLAADTKLQDLTAFVTTLDAGDAG